MENILLPCLRLSGRHCDGVWLCNAIVGGLLEVVGISMVKSQLCAGAKIKRALAVIRHVYGQDVETSK